MNVNQATFPITLMARMLGRVDGGLLRVAEAATFGSCRRRRNPVRPHSALGYQSPISCEKQQTQALEAAA